MKDNTTRIFLKGFPAAVSRFLSLMFKRQMSKMSMFLKKITDILVITDSRQVKLSKASVGKMVFWLHFHVINFPSCRHQVVAIESKIMKDEQITCKVRTFRWNLLLNSKASSWRISPKTFTVFLLPSFILNKLSASMWLRTLGSMMSR